MLSMWVAIFAFAFSAAVLLSVLVTGPPSRPNLFAVLFVVAIAGLGFTVMSLQVREYKETNPPSKTFGLPVKAEHDQIPRPTFVPSTIRSGAGAAAPAAARNPYIEASRQR
jgi:hypothetical protein